MPCSDVFSTLYTLLHSCHKEGSTTGLFSSCYLLTHNPRMLSIIERLPRKFISTTLTPLACEQLLKPQECHFLILICNRSSGSVSLCYWFSRTPQTSKFASHFPHTLFWFLYSPIYASACRTCLPFQIFTCHTVSHSFCKVYLLQLFSFRRSSTLCSVTWLF